MAMTKGEACQAALRWIDEATVGGRPLDSSCNADLLDRMAYLLDGAVAAVCGSFPHRAVYSVCCSAPRSLLQNGTVARTVWPPESYQVSPGSFCSFSLEVRGSVSVKIMARGSCILQRQVESEQLFTQLCANAAGDTLLITGTAPFTVRNVGLYPDSYPDGSIPAAAGWVQIQLPPDFAGLEQVLYSGDGVQYAAFSDYRQISHGVCAVPQNLNGQLDFYYIRTPAHIGAQAADTTRLDIRPDAQELVPLRLALALVSGVEETAPLAEVLAARYREMTAALTLRQQPITARVEAVYVC